MSNFLIDLSPLLVGTIMTMSLADWRKFLAKHTGREERLELNMLLVNAAILAHTLGNRHLRSVVARRLAVLQDIRKEEAMLVACGGCHRSVRPEQLICGLCPDCATSEIEGAL